MSKTAFWILSWTWGFIMTFIGGLVFITLSLCGYKPRRNQYGWAFEVGKSWGGVEFGPVCVVNKNPSDYIFKTRIWTFYPKLLLRPIYDFYFHCFCHSILV